MDKEYVNTLKQRKAELLDELKRKSELESELNHIDGILKLYPEERSLVNNKIASKSNKIARKNNITIKDQILGVIRDLGGSVYVSDVVNEIHRNDPSRDKKSINNQVRTYIYLLKKQRKLRSEEKGQSKFLYHLIE